MCCGNRLDTVAYQARIISSQDISLDTIKTAIQEWVANEPALPGKSVLKMSSTWQYNLSENTLHVKCGTEASSGEQEQKQDMLKVFTIILVILILLVIIVIMVMVVLVVLKCHEKKQYSAER